MLKYYLVKRYRYKLRFKTFDKAYTTEIKQVHACFDT